MLAGESACVYTNGVQGLVKETTVRRVFFYSLCAISLGVIIVLCAGCDGGGLTIKVTPPDAGDRPGGWDPGDWDPGPWEPGSPDPGGSTPQDSRFTGQWVASFGDDRATANARFGPIQYAMSLSIRQSGSSLSGNGILFRVFREGPTASNRIAVQVSGTASGDDATFSVRSSGLDRDQLWHVRLAGSRMVGMYVARGDTGEVVRSGHTVWHKAITRAYENIPWVAAYTDDFGFTGFPRRSRTASITPVLSQSGIGGSGTFYEHRGMPPQVDFDILRGGVSGAELGLTFGGLDLVDNEVDWFGFFGGNIIEAAYGQFDASDALIRFGHTTWVRAPVRELTAINGAWAGSFRDQTVETPGQPADFVAVFNLTAASGGEVTGYALIRNEADDAPDFRRYNVDEGSIVGTQVQVSVSRVASSFFWDLRLGDGNGGSGAVVNDF